MECFSKRKLIILFIMVCLVLSMVGWIALASEEPDSHIQPTEKKIEESAGRVHSRDTETLGPPVSPETSIPESIPDQPDQNVDSSAPAASVETPEPDPVEEADLEALPINEESGEQVLIFNCNSKGYSLSFPPDSIIHSDPRGYDARVAVGNCLMEISKERSPYSEPESDMTRSLEKLVPDFRWEDGVDQYIGYYESRFLLNKTWQENNQVAVSDIEYPTFGDRRGFMFHAIISGVPEDRFNAYTYVFVRMEDRSFLRIVAKYISSESNPAEETWQKNMIKTIACSLKTFQPGGSDGYPKPVYRQERNAPWTGETSTLYDRISKIGTEDAYEEDKGKMPLWGICSKDMTNTGINERIPEIERQLDYSFAVLLTYCHFTGRFPEDFMNKAREEGKIVELTYQLTKTDNRELYGRSLSMDLYRQDPEILEEIRRFAREAKVFGSPFLFRLCNEMNSDWVSYGGVVNMADPDIYVDNWRTVYRIFEEEGVDNCIWIYNPNNGNAPPDDWNGVRSYYPGNEYVDIIGVTGYNPGIYYVQYLEKWREFKDIYDEIQRNYGDDFGAFPWMITEFSSSSYGGDKATWIRGMFQNIRNYPNIKIAVWFDSADYDLNGTLVRPYWIDETEETLNAFREGLKNSS